MTSDPPRVHAGVSNHLRSNVVGYMALFVALSGSAYAATAARNSVKSSSIKNGQVKEADLGDASVTGSKLAPGAVNIPNIPTIPPSLPPTGSAGGDLGGSYPNPTIADGAVGTSKLAGGAVTPDKRGAVPAVRAFIPVADCSTGLASGSDTALRWLLENFDTAGMHTSSNCPSPDAAASQLVAPRGGIYQIDAGALWGDNSVGERFLGLRINGSNYVAGARAAALGGNGTSQTVSSLVALSPGDYAEVVVFQNSGSANSISGDSRSFFAMHWIGPAQ